MSDTNNQTIAAYQAHVQEYLDGSPQIVDGHVKEWLDNVLEDLDKKADILEIGCGTGKDADYIESLGYIVERTDATKAFVDLQVSRNHDARLLNVIEDEITNTYDFVLADAVLLHFTAQETRVVLNKVMGALNNNGIFAFSLKQGDGDELTDQKLGATRYFKYWQKAEIEQELQAAGFHAMEIVVVEDYRGPHKPAWFMISASKGEAKA